MDEVEIGFTRQELQTLWSALEIARKEFPKMADPSSAGRIEALYVKVLEAMAWECLRGE